MPNSLPALVAGILASDHVWAVRSCARRFERAPLVPAYQVDAGLPLADQAEQAAQAMIELSQKLFRLEEAYPNWPVFEPGPFFDLYPDHLHDFCRAEETRRVVRVRIYADLLLPAFRDAERYWIDSFLPAYHAGHNGHVMDAFRTHLVEETMPAMERLLDEAEQTITHTLRLLSDRLDVLTYLGGLEERIQHRPRPGATLAPGLSQALQRLPREMPTLTLDALFPRPVEDLPERAGWPVQAVSQEGS
jgi:hypothetical protein